MHKRPGEKCGLICFDLSIGTPFLGAPIAPSSSRRRFGTVVTRLSRRPSGRCGRTGARSDFHGLSTGAVPRNNGAPVGRRWKSRSPARPAMFAGRAGSGAGAVGRDGAGQIATVDHADMRGLVTDPTSLRRGAGLSLVAGVVAPEGPRCEPSADAVVARPRVLHTGPAPPRSNTRNELPSFNRASTRRRRLRAGLRHPRHLDADDVPHEAGQLARHGHGRLLRVLAGREQVAVATAQAPLGAPGDGPGLCGRAGRLAFQMRRATCREPVAPGRLHQRARRRPPELCSLGTNPRNAINWRGESKRPMSPSSASSVAAVIRSTPRNATSARATGASDQSDNARSSCPVSAATRSPAVRAASRYSRYAHSCQSRSKRWPPSHAQCALLQRPADQRRSWRSRNAPRRWRALRSASFRSDRARTRSRIASWSSSGTHTAVNSPPRDSRASLRASRRSVFTRSAGALGMRDGATTSQSKPRPRNWRYNPYPQGPAS